MVVLTRNARDETQRPEYSERPQRLHVEAVLDQMLEHRTDHAAKHTGVIAAGN